MLNPLTGMVEDIAGTVVPDQIEPLAAQVSPQLAGGLPDAEAMSAQVEVSDLPSILAGLQWPGITTPLPAGPPQAAFAPF